MAATRVLRAAKMRHAIALARERFDESAVSSLPQSTLFHRRSPMNIVPDFEICARARGTLGGGLGQGTRSARMCAGRATHKVPADDGSGGGERSGEEE